MYIPKSFAVDDWAIIEDTIEQYPFVDHLGISNGSIIVSKAPLIYKGNKQIHFHLAKGNPLSKVVTDSKMIELLISGPHDYISPTWYGVAPTVPTWNYVAIQITIQCQLNNDEKWLMSHHQDLTNKFEKSGWKNELPDDFRGKLNNMIDGVVGKVIKYEAKYKLGQNRSNDDFTGIYKALTLIDKNNAIAKIMKRLYPEKINEHNSM